MLFKRNSFPATIHLSALSFFVILIVSSSVAFAISPTLESCPETGVSFDYSYYSCVNYTHIEKKKGTCSGSNGNPLMEESNTYACSEFHDADNLLPFSRMLNSCITCDDTGNAVCVSNSSEEEQVCEFARTGRSGPFFDGNLKMNFNICHRTIPSSYWKTVQYKTGSNSWGTSSESQVCSTDDKKYCVQCQNSMQLCSNANGTCTEIFEGFSPTSSASEAIMVHSKNIIATNFLLAIAAHSLFLALVF